MSRTQCVLASMALFLGLAYSWDIALTAGDRIEFYTISGTKTDTVNFGSQNLTEIVYDEVHNMLLYVNKQSDNDAICGYNLTSEEYKCYIERNGSNIHGLAFDPITEMLFFTDTMERSINWISFKPGSDNNVNGNLLIKMADGIPTDIAVDSCRGYVYWINSNLIWSPIERARFDGSEREVIFNSSYAYKGQSSLAIDQQTQKIYWFMAGFDSFQTLCSADLNGKDGYGITDYFTTLETHPNALTTSKGYLLMVEWCSACDPRFVWKFTYPSSDDGKGFIKLHTKSMVGIAAKYKISEQFQGVKGCKTINSYKIAREYIDPFCDHGIKLIGQSLCKCTPGYTGKRCDISLCVNYCLQGICSFNEEGLPKCRCNAGYSGERCEVNVCHGYCLNNGACSLNKENEPICQCINDYAGDRCDVPVCLNNNDCSLNEEGSRCKANKNNTLFNTTTYYTTERNLTLADLLAKWRKPVSTIVVVEVEPN